MKQNNFILCPQTINNIDYVLAILQNTVVFLGTHSALFSSDVVRENDVKIQRIVTQLFTDRSMTILLWIPFLVHKDVYQKTGKDPLHVHKLTKAENKRLVRER